MTKGPDAFRTISEAADELGAPQHVLRFWETKFSFIRPMKRAGGRRFYRRQDIEVLRAVRTLLHERGYSIKDVQQLHKQLGVRQLMAVAEGAEATEPAAEGVEAAEAARALNGTEAEEAMPALKIDDALQPDMFADTAPPEITAEPEQAPRPEPARTAPARRGLSPAARARLGAVLSDLEGMKDRVDALLSGGR